MLHSSLFLALNCLTAAKDLYMLAAKCFLGIPGTHQNNFPKSLVGNFSGKAVIVVKQNIQWASAS